MTLSASPALQQVETALKVSPGSFTKNNYRSVFDIARTSRKQFISENMSWLGLRGGKAWDLAVGQAQHIRRLFRESQLTRQIRQGLPQTLSGQQVVNSTSSNNIQGLVQDGPTWRNQFAENWQAYCQSGAPEAVDSPVSYLTWLYKQALSFEEEIKASSTADQVITLAERRPDLATLTVDNDAINQEIPALQLVNEILENSIATSLPSEQSVDETLAETRYPTLLPYHFPHDQAELALLKAGVPLEEIISETATDWPWFLNDAWQGARSASSTELASGLAPEQQTLVIEADNSTATDMTAFYKTNLGVEMADYTPFEDIDTFTYQLGITVPQVEELIAGNGDGSTSVVISPNITFYSFEDLVLNGAETASGRFDNALSCYNRQNSYAYFPSDSGPAELMKGDKSFSVSMWINMSALPTDNQMPIICNSYLDGSIQGIRLCVNNGDFLLALRDSASNHVDNAKKKNDDSAATVSPNLWYLVCFVLDNSNKKAIVYYQAEGESSASTIEVDTSSLTGDLTAVKNCTWVLNDGGDMTYYDNHPVPATLVNCLYDEVGLFAGVLAIDDFNKIFSAGVPLLNVSSQLSMPFTYYYAMSYSANSNGYGARFINAGKGPDIALNSPETSELLFSNVASVTGKYGQGIQTRSTDDSYFYFQPEGKVAQAMKGDKSFTLGFWVNRLHYDARFSPLVSNGGDANDPTYASGFSLTCYLYPPPSGFWRYDITMYLCDKKNENVNIDWTQDGIETNKFYYIALSWDAMNKQAVWYRFLNNDSKTFSLDASALGDITTAPGFTWAFNTRGDLTHSSKSTEDTPNFIYDDIAVFGGVLTPENIATLATSGKSVVETNTAGFSADCIWTSSLDHGLQNLSDARMDRINRMVRLQRWLGLSYEETDLLLSACIRAQGTDNADFSLNAHTLRALGIFRHWQQKYGVTAFQFAAVLDEITPYAISPAVPFFDQIFNSPSLFDAPFAITGETVNYAAVTGDSARTVRQICAGLGITQAQFRVLADKVAAEQGDAEAKTFPLTLPVVSALYRLVMVPRWLGLSFADGAALLSLAGEGDKAWATLAGVPQLAALTGGQPADGDILDLLMALDAAAAWAAEHQLSWVKNYLALQPGSDALVATAATVNFVNDIKQQLPTALLSEKSFDGVPLPADSTASSWLSVLPDLIDGNGLVQVAATDYSTIAAMVEADITRASITFATDAERAQAISSLSGIINQARLAQNGIADSALAQMFGTSQSLPPYLLTWAEDSEYRLLSDSLAMNGGPALTDPSQVSATYLTDLFALGQRAGISTAFGLTPATLALFLAHPEWFGVSDTTLSLTLLYRFSRYGDWLKVAEDEDRVLAYLSWVNAATPPDATHAAEALALLLGWESSEVADATATLSEEMAKSAADVDYVMRLQQLSTQTGLSVTPLLATGELAPGGVSATWDAWQSAGESLVAAQNGQQ